MVVNCLTGNFTAPQRGAFFIWLADPRGGVGSDTNTHKTQGGWGAATPPHRENRQALSAG